MPIHSIGYRTWDGRRLSGATRWAVIASTGIRRTWKSKWLRRMLAFSLIGPLLLSVGLFILEQWAIDPDGWAQVFVQALQFLPNNNSLTDMLLIDPRTATPEQIEPIRYNTWAVLLLTLFRYPQSSMLVLVMGIAAPSLIANDVRSRAFLIYFSRPITRLEYILGKMGTMVFYLLMITTLPAILLYLAGVALSPDISVVFKTWDLPLRILAASAMLILPTTSVALMFSSMTTESRYAGFAWFALWILGYVMFGIVMAYSTVLTGGVIVDPGWRALLSPYHTLGFVQAWAFGLEAETDPVIPAAVILISVTVASLALLYYRVSSPMRA